jgi:hydroxyethylthiazole kinase
MRAPNDLSHMAGAVLAGLRARKPRVHCITNTVAQAFTPNVLLAAGAVPSMTVARDEIGAFVASADALLVNLGTLDAERRAAAKIAVETANARGIPWVLDPVFVDRSVARAAFAQSLVAARPAAIRLNAPEFRVLAQAEAGAEEAMRYASETGAAIGLTGATDLVADRTRRATLANGDPLMAKITAMGCAASALVAACLAVERDALGATAAGLLMLGVAGEIAAQEARGPGSLAVGILDALHALDGATLVARAKVR